MLYINQHKITDKIGAFVSDGGSDVTLGISNANLRQSRCFNHVLSNVTGHWLKVSPISTLFTKCKKISKQNLKLNQVKEDVQEKYIPQNGKPPPSSIRRMVPTRWLSSYAMCCSILYNASKINFLLSSSKDTDILSLVLDEEDLKLLDYLTYFLNNLNTVHLEVEKDNSIVASALYQIELLTEILRVLL